MGDDSFSDLVRALAAIHTNSQNSEINVAKVGSTVEYFRALVEAQKESSRKQTESLKHELELELTPEAAEPSPNGSESWLPLIPSDEFIKMLKNAQTFASSNTTEPEIPSMWDLREDSPISNFTSFFGPGNSSFALDNDLYANGTFQLNRDMTGFTNLSNLKDILGTFKQNLDESSKLSDSVIYSLIAIYSAVIVVGLLGMDIL